MRYCMSPKIKQTVSIGLLVLTAMIWGIAFVAQSVGSEHVGPFTFLASRSFIAGIALLPVITIRRKTAPADSASSRSPKNLWMGGIACGIALVAASAFQQKKRAPLSVWLGVLIAALGMYLLCINESFSLSRGDLLVLICSCLYAVHILVIDHFSPLTDGVQMSCIQFFTCGTVAAIAMLIFEHPTKEALHGAWLPILYAGLFSSAIGYTLQIVAQKSVPPTVASLVMSLESVFSVLAGWLILHQSLSLKELIGCGLVFCAIILAQLPAPKKN